MLTRTTTALLQDLVDPANEGTWHVFDARYRPILVAFGRRLGLSPEDAADAAQETLARFVKSYRAGKYDRMRGRLHSWLIGIARHCIIDLQQKRASRREQRGMSAIVELPGDDPLAAVWQAECEREILEQAVASIRCESRMDERTIRAFEMLAFEQQTPAEVAASLDMTANDVYLAKHRCLKRLRAVIAGLREAYEIE